ncbi:MAG TPA: sodium:solute symporter family protein [Planctomycetota bacterium]|nr:sodium:solute symporter family protein [Planctomycetota bacterium]
MVPLIVIGVYLAIVLYISIFAFSRGKTTGEDFFLASRTIGTLVFFLSLFATNMTAFAILGSSGMAYKQGIGVFGLMASSSGFVIPMTLFFIGTRLWALGKKFGHMTQVQYFRDRWECSSIGTVIFLLSVAMLIPYMIISIMGGGRVLVELSGGGGAAIISKPIGCAIVAVTVTIIVFFGGMRGTVWVNIFQTILFLLFGLVAVWAISRNLDFGAIVSKMAEQPKTRALITREGPAMNPWFFWSYTLVPLSSIMFPHMSIMCLSARKVSAFKKTVVVYPIAIMLIWLPCVFLGTIGSQVIKLEGNATDGILLAMLREFSHSPLLAGILGAGIISAVMGSDCHQVLAVSTMFTKDIFSYYGGDKKYGEKGVVWFGRAFILIITVIAYIIALNTSENIFELAVRFAFSGFAAMSPVMVAALFWKRSTKWGALASTLVVGGMLAGGYVLSQKFKPGAIVWDWKIHGVPALSLNPLGDPRFFGMHSVVPMVLGSAVAMILISIISPPPSRATIEKYFPAGGKI